MNNGLSGLQKAGVLMVSLGAQDSAKVFDCLTPEERDLLGAQIVKFRHIDESTRRDVLEEVSEIIVRYQGAPETVNPAAIEPPADSDEPLKWLESLDAREVASMIGRERPQNIALVLAHIAPQSAADILCCLSETVRNHVAHRLATMKPVSREAIEAVDEAMRKRAGKVNARHAHEGLLSIIGNATERVKDSVGMALHVPAAASIITGARAFTTPEDMLRLSDADMKMALAAVDADDLCLALHVAGDELRSAVLRCMPEEAGLALQTQYSSAARIRVRDIERAQTRIVDTLNTMFAADRALEASVG